jgi:phosphate acetyltransferase
MTEASSPFLSPDAPVCPPELLARAQAFPKLRVAIANAGAELPMWAAYEATQKGLITPLFTGDRGVINDIAARLDWDIAGCKILDADSEEKAGLAAAIACGRGDADILMKGDIHSDTFLKTALTRDANLRTGNRLVHFFHISPPNGGRAIVISDGAVNVTPDIKTRQTATLEMTQLLQKLGIARPKIAFLSATESPVPSVPSSLEARELRDWASANIKGADFSGPLALDLILSQQSARLKELENDPVAGHADGVIVPDIVSGNVLFKSLVYLAGGCAAGLITGARVPLLLTSRADPPAARLASIALAVIASTNAKTPDG